MITNKEEVVQKIERLIRSRHATSFFINGAPGSGKSHMLTHLSKQLCSRLQLSRCNVVGPCKLIIGSGETPALKILTNLAEMGFVDHLPSPSHALSLIDVWRRVAEESGGHLNRTFIVLFDIDYSDGNQISSIGELFSSMRNFEGVWTGNHLRVHHIAAGYWNQHALYDFYRQSSVSFPYTIGHNYVIWDGLTANQIVELLEREMDVTNYTYGRLLFELSGGHPQAAIEILQHVTNNNLSLSAFLTATQKAAAEGALQKRLVPTWRNLPNVVKELLQKLVIRRHVSASLPQTIVNHLFVSGLVRRDRVGAKDYLSFRSWYIELVVRLHASELGLTDARIEKIQLEEFVPPVTATNTEAYQLIHDIENAARNFVATQLSLGHLGDDHILRGKNEKIVDGQYEDQYQRAVDWQRRSARRGLSTELNPLLAYCSTTELAKLVRTIGIELGQEPWENISDAIRGLVPIRDAVMHNQLITDEDLQQIYNLRNSIYDALSELE